MDDLTCFKAYDIRGRVGVDLDEGLARRIGRAFAAVLQAKQVVIGRDCRASSEVLATATMQGLRERGADVIDLGLCGTEEVYFATSHFQADGGIEITASHNPVEYNGMKLVGRGSTPLGAGSGFAAIRALVERGGPEAGPRMGRMIPGEGARAAYVERVLSFVDPGLLRPMTVLVNAGNGAAGPTFDAIAAELARRGALLRFVRHHHAPDGSFPNGIPNPMLPGNQKITSEAVVAAGADMGVAWDGDFDRCFLFDHAGRFVAGEYVVGLLAAVFLEKEPGATIVHDPRVIWNTEDEVRRAGGQSVKAKTGHAFLKQALRETGAVYGGEMSAHHYFRDFMACDSGMIPWLLVAELMGRTGRSLADLVAARMRAFPSSGEINFECGDIPEAMLRVEAGLAELKPARDDLDGMSLSFGDWRLNLRGSNTEPLLRLNIETRGRGPDMAGLVARVRGLIEAA